MDLTALHELAEDAISSETIDDAVTCWLHPCASQLRPDLQDDLAELTSPVHCVQIQDPDAEDCDYWRHPDRYLIDFAFLDAARDGSDDFDVQGAVESVQRCLGVETGDGPFATNETLNPVRWANFLITLVKEDPAIQADLVARVRAGADPGRDRCAALTLGILDRHHWVFLDQRDQEARSDQADATPLSAVTAELLERPVTRTQPLDAGDELVPFVVADARPDDPLIPPERLIHACAPPIVTVHPSLPGDALWYAAQHYPPTSQEAVARHMIMRGAQDDPEGPWHHCWAWLMTRSHIPAPAKRLLDLPVVAGHLAQAAPDAFWMAVVQRDTPLPPASIAASVPWTSARRADSADIAWSLAAGAPAEADDADRIDWGCLVTATCYARHPQAFQAVGAPGAVATALASLPTNVEHAPHVGAVRRALLTGLLQPSA